MAPRRLDAGAPGKGMPKPSHAELDALLAAERGENARLSGENARLIAGLNDSNASLREALEQQTATAQVLETISRSPADLQRVLDAICAAATRLCRAEHTAVMRAEGEVVRVLAQHGAGAVATGATIPRVGAVAARAMEERRPVHVPDVVADLPTDDPRHAEVRRQLGHSSLVVVPLLLAGEAVGSLNVRRQRVDPFTDRQIALLETFADQAAIAIENSRLFSELRERLEEQTATAEVLAAISHAPTDLRRVLDTIAESAQRLCAGEGASIWWGEGSASTMLAWTGASGVPLRPVGERWPELGRAPGDYTATGEVFHTPDLSRDERLGEGFRRSAAERGVAALLAAPLVAAGAVRGAINVRRAQARPFSERQIALIKTFADQAAIESESARVFAELQERLAEQAATSRVLRTIAESPTDPQRALDAIVDAAARLTGTERASIVLRDGEGVRSVAASGASGVRRTLAHPGAPRPPPDPTDGTQLAVPLLLEDAAVGHLVLAGDQPRRFEEAAISLARTLADHAVVAIDNARLYGVLPSPSAPSEVLQDQGRAGPAVDGPGIRPSGARTANAHWTGLLPVHLTQREREVARLIADGRTNREIADTLVIAESTAERHVTNVLGKLGLRGRAQLAAWYTQAGSGLGQNPP